MLASNLANCWKNLLFRLISRKLFINKNLHNIFWKDIKLEIINIYIKFINKNINRFFRDHMLKTIKNYNNYTTSNKVNNRNLGSYLAGLIEGDGSIYIPKDNKNAFRIIITFNSKDLPLALIIQKNLNHGNIYKKRCN
jgi:LAGLIDADG endonuclease